MLFSEHAAVRSVVQNPCRSIRATGPQKPFGARRYQGRAG